jgi:hypothetical protein
MLIDRRVRNALRKAGALAAAVLPTQYKVRAERYLRGWEEYQLLENSDVVVVSFGKSGRTWLRVLLSRFYQVRYGLPASNLIRNDSFHRLNAAVPRVHFTHDNYLSDFTGTVGSKSDYAGKRILLLVRHPADVAVSQFFHWKHRMKPRKRLLNAYPNLDELALADFVFDEISGIPEIIRFMNQWANELNAFDELLVVRYESLRATTLETLGRILSFMGEEPTPEELAECVRFSSVEHMRALEQRQFFQNFGRRMAPGDPSNPESYKVRRAKVNGYLDYFQAEQVVRISTLVSENLSPVYGYGAIAADTRVV